MAERLKLGELLVQAGAIDQTQLGAALSDQQQFGGPLGMTLVRMGFLDEEALSARWHGSSSCPSPGCAESGSGARCSSWFRPSSRSNTTACPSR